MDPQDDLFPVYCTKCRKQVSRDESNRNHGLCDVCASATTVMPPQPPPSPPTQGPQCPFCSSFKVAWKLAPPDPTAMALRWIGIIMLPAALCIWPLIFISVALIVGGVIMHARSKSTMVYCQDCRREWSN